MIKLVRLDYRLLHGQVVFAWTRNFGIDFIVVADNETAGDDFKKMTLGKRVEMQQLPTTPCTKLNDIL